MRRALAHERGDLGERLDDAGLVVDEHHGDDRGALVERGRERVEVDATVGTGTDRRDAEALALEPVAAPRTALCSIPVVTTPSPVPRSRAIQAAPFTARLSASLPLPVNTISRGRAPQRAGDRLARRFERGLRRARDAP